MLVALVAGRPGLARAAALALLSLSVLFGVGLFGGQWASPAQFGCVLWGEDFVTIYTSGKLVVSGRGAEVYKLPRVEESAVRAVLEQARPHCGFTWPLEYWLGFLLPVFPFTLFTPRLAYYLWTALSVALFAFSVWRLARARGVSPWPFWLICFGFYPVIFGLLQGQVHGWQFLALTEFWLAARRRADRSAGVWLSALLVKPQFVPLIALYLLWHRRWRVVGWLMAGALVWLGLTLLFAGGREGAEAYLAMASRSLSDGRNSLALLMPNWHFVAFVAFGKEGPPVFWSTVGLSVLTAALLAWSWRRRPNAARMLEPQAFLVLVTGTLLVGYQTFVYSAVLMLPGVLAKADELAKARGHVARVWSLVLDFALLSPTGAAIVFVLLFGRGIFVAAVLSGTLLAGTAAILLAGVFAPVREEVKSEASGTERAGTFPVRL